MAGVTSTGSLPLALWPGVQGWWGQFYDEHPLLCEQMFDRSTSNKAYEEVGELVGFGLAPVKNEGGAVSYDTQQQGITNRFTNKVYALGYIVTKEEFKDNQYEQVAEARTRGLAFSMRTTKETVGANVLNRGFNASYARADGVSLLNTAHPDATGSTQSNALAVAADLSEASLEDILIQIGNATDSRGLPVNIMAEQLIVSPNDMFNAARILKSVQQNDTANNAINAIQSLGMLGKGFLSNPYLTDTDAWFVKTNVPEGMLLFQREEMEISRDNDFDSSNMKVKAEERYVFGVADFRGIYGSAGA